MANEEKEKKGFFGGFKAIFALTTHGVRFMSGRMAKATSSAAVRAPGPRSRSRISGLWAPPGRPDGTGRGP